MGYQYKGKQEPGPAYVCNYGDDPAAKFAYFRKAEAQINGGPTPFYAEPAPAPVRPRRPKAECGTHSGYKRHRENEGRVTCRACLDARAIYQRDYRARRAICGPIAGPYGTKPGPKPRPLKPFDKTLCGTMAGWRQHRKHGQDKCRGCLDAHNEYIAEWRAKRSAR